jgi:predicted Zn-dependent protease
MTAARLLCLFALVLAPSASAVDDEVDPLALAAVLLDGGDADRAWAVLEEGRAAAVDADPARYWLLRGIAAQQLGKDEVAYTALRRAAALQRADQRVQLLLARAAWQTGRAQATLDALEAAGPGGADRAARVALRADALLKLGRHGGALSVLRQGWQATGEPALRAREVQLYADLRLFRSAEEAARDLLKGDKGVAMTVIERLRAAGGHREAATLAEALHLRHPDDIEVNLLLAQALTSVGQPTSAALIYDTLMMRDPAYATDAAELYRRVGRLDAALWRNGLAPSTTRKWRQRFGLLVELGRAHEAAAMAPRLERLALTDEGTVAYALGWALFETGDTWAAEKVLKRIDDPAVFNEATALRQRIAACRSSPGPGCP